MSEGKKERTVQVLYDGKWIDLKFEDMKKGHVFRMFEPDGTPVSGLGEFAGVTEYLATEDAHLTSGVWGLKADHVPKGL